MALICCPECGQMVSDKAAACIHCGSPLAGMDKVKIKLLFFNDTSVMGRARACDVEIYNGSKKLWSGPSGTAVTLTVPDPTSLRFHVIHCYTGHPMPFYRDFDIYCNVEPGKKYQMRVMNQSLMDPTKAKYGLTEVEIIDAD